MKQLTHSQTLVPYSQHLYRIRPVAINNKKSHHCNDTREVIPPIMIGFE